MNNRRSWRVCESAFEQIPSSFLCQRSCAVINHCMVSVSHNIDRLPKVDPFL